MSCYYQVESSEYGIQLEKFLVGINFNELRFMKDS